MVLSARPASGGPSSAGPGESPELAGLVAHWHNEPQLERLVAAWPRDPRFELIVVDNGSTRTIDPGPAQMIRPPANRGFAGAVNLAARRSSAPLLLLLNPDVVPRPGALAGLVDGFARWPEAGGLAPKLVDGAGRPQHRWQLRPLPTLPTLWLQTLLLPAGRGGAREPAAGAAVAQPAAAALALRRRTFDELGGLDEAFYPAWFEDVDLAARLRTAGKPILYAPEAVFEHDLGATVPRLGYGLFLWLYYRNQERYLCKHHGGTAAVATRPLLAAGATLRLLLLPLRRPRRAESRWAAARALAALAAGAMSGWRLPAARRREWSPGPAVDPPADSC